jgi:polyhydroxyalkanoate synthase
MGTPVKWMRLFQNLGNDRFLDFFRALETWINDNVNIPKAFYKDLIGKLYREDALYRGTLMVGGEPVILEEIRVPVLTVAAKQDHIVPPQSAAAGHERYSSTDKRLEIYDGGHIGVAVGGLARRNLWPLMLEWLETHKGSQSAKGEGPSTGEMRP